jgi:hypothetical protein
MKRPHALAALTTAVVALLALSGNVSANKGEQPRCTVATLKGSFGYTVTGALAAGPTPGPFAAVGRIIFDGAGNFQNIRTISRNGAITSRAQGIGTYSVEPDCTGALTFTDGGIVTLGTDIVIDADGNEFRMIATSPGTVLTISARRQFTSQGKK